MLWRNTSIRKSIGVGYLSVTVTLYTMLSKAMRLNEITQGAKEERGKKRSED